jgi:hypothetical protein
VRGTVGARESWRSSLPPARDDSARFVSEVRRSVVGKERAHPGSADVW